LDERSILLEYFVGKSASYMFAVTHDQAQVYELSNEKTLSSLITQIRDVLQKPDLAFQLSEKSHTKFVNLAFDLHQKLFKPIQSLAQGKSRIIISPDGPLHYLPFEVLLSDNVSARSPNFAHLPYLARDFEIRYVPSVSVFSLFAQRDLNGQEIQHKQLLAFADPAFGKGSQASSSIREWVGTLGALPYTRPEVQGIASLYPSDQTNVFIGSQATEKNLKSLDLQQYKYIHFASHGLIDEQKPQFSALILSPDAKNEEDGFLTAREVFDLKLNADLVVLSACKTGLGKRIRGEGVTGLSRAFLCAGAPSVLVSLWNVYDHSTAEFMKDFYQSLEEQKMNKADALREARLKMMKTSKYSHPYYWAPFVLIGNN
jgi:CHAT domain-containing protein